MTTPTTTETVDQIMRLADEVAEVRAEHLRLITLYANDQADYAEIPPLADQWVQAREALRQAVAAAVKGA